MPSNSLFQRAGLSFLALLSGQAISLFIAGTSTFTEYLSSHTPAVTVPLLLSSVTYVLLSFHIVYRYYNDGKMWKPLKVVWWKYALLAVVDLQANYLVIRAYMFTSMASVALLDAFSIPCCVVMSYFFLNVRYTKQHLVGVLLCAAGVALSFISDLFSKKEPTSTAPLDNALWGDCLVLLSGFLYALSNIMQETIVKTMDRVEYLGMLGFFGAIFAWLQMLSLHPEELDGKNFFPGSFLLMAGFSLCLFAMYVTTSIFLTFADSALFNMSLLTADFYVAIIFIFLFDGNITSLYVVAFVLIGCGLIVYGKEPISGANKPIDADDDAGPVSKALLHNNEGCEKHDIEGPLG